MRSLHALVARQRSRRVAAAAAVSALARPRYAPCSCWASRTMICRFGISARDRRSDHGLCAAYWSRVFADALFRRAFLHVTGNLRAAMAGSPPIGDPRLLGWSRHRQHRPTRGDTRSRRAHPRDAVLEKIRAVVRHARSGAERGGAVSPPRKRAYLTLSAHHSRLREYRGGNRVCVQHVEQDHTFLA
jgi:hypothetical protein